MPSLNPTVHKNSAKTAQCSRPSPIPKQPILMMRILRPPMNSTNTYLIMDLPQKS